MILPDFLFLGGELIDEEQVEELEKLGIKRVLNMAVNCDDDLWVQRFGQSGYLKVGLRDHVDQDLKDGLDEAVKFIGKLFDRNNLFFLLGSCRCITAYTLIADFE